MILAAIDIGSNAARLLINDVRTNSKKHTEFIKLNLLRIPLRLGMDVFSKGEIGEERKKMLIDSMSIFASLMEIYKVEAYRACATSAMRDAANGLEIIQQVMDTSGIKIEIISGDEEANLVYENHIAESLDKSSSYLYIDVGGGSTELTFYEEGKMKFEKSFNIGTIRLLNNLVDENTWEQMKQEVQAKIKTKKTIVAIGAGGNINKIFSMSKQKEGKPLGIRFLKQLYKEASKMSVEERMTSYNVREDRADVMVPALEIYTNVLSWLDIGQIFVPKISVADGLIHHVYEQHKKRKKA